MNTVILLYRGNSFGEKLRPLTLFWWKPADNNSRITSARCCTNADQKAVRGLNYWWHRTGSEKHSAQLQARNRLYFQCGDFAFCHKQTKTFPTSTIGWDHIYACLLWGITGDIHVTRTVFVVSRVVTWSLLNCVDSSTRTNESHQSRLADSDSTLQGQKTKWFGDFTKHLSFCNSTSMISSEIWATSNGNLKRVPRDTQRFYGVSALEKLFFNFLRQVLRQGKGHCWSLFWDQIELVQEFVSSPWGADPLPQCY